MCKGIINKIIPFSSVDGPGNRMAIFLQGCNFNCSYCHNPETINYCSNCGECVNHCPYNALTIINGKIKWNKEICQDCDKCIRICKFNSTPKTTLVSVSEVLNEIKKVKPFISGTTISGGECTLQLDFIMSLFKEVKKLGLTTFIDTNGSVPLYKYPELLELMDGAMIDAKSFSLDEHYDLTGCSNDITIKNIIELGKIKKLYEVRTVIVPEILDNINNVNEISKLLASIDTQIRYKLIKFRSIGVREEFIDSDSPDDDMMSELQGVALDNGCNNVIIV